MEEIFRNDAYAKSCAAEVVSAGSEGIRLNRTVFYPLGGGQPGDSGFLILDDGSRIRISDTRKGDGPEDIVHVPEDGSALPGPGTKVTAEIDWERRLRHMRMHTCLHLLCSVVEGDVTAKIFMSFSVP